MAPRLKLVQMESGNRGQTYKGLGQKGDFVQQFLGELETWEG